MTTTPWADVRPGDVLLGGDGHEWTVTAKAPGTVALAREGAKPFTKRLTPGDERTGVALVASANDVLYDAIRDVQDVLGGTVIQTQADGDQPMCPVDYATPGTMLAHLYTLHGVKFDGKRIEGVYERRYMERDRSHFRLVQPDGDGGSSPEQGGS